ncbi:MAG: DUF4145 domain-containing protein [Mesorhizobium sp.]|nr:MAG: DUF4145 domain-containing protein [Mesorhizobium sp.]
MTWQGDSFAFLQAFWPDLHALAREAEQSAGALPVFAAIRLRGFAEAMVNHLFNRLNLSWKAEETHFERLRLLQLEGFLDAQLLAKFHTIRKLGNLAAHNGAVTDEQAGSLIEDAWSLASWFCRYMRPDVEWLTPRRSASASSATSADASRDGEVPRQDPGATIALFPEGRVKRIREDVAAAINQLEPQMRPLRTRIKLHEAFEAELTDDQERCISALEAFLADDSQRVFLLKGYAGTGKTFLAAGLTEYLLTQGRAFSLAAPTGRAAKVMASKTGQSARTIHSLIYDYSNMIEHAEDGEDGSATFKMIATVAQNEAPINAVYIVDEASLISDVYTESEFFRLGSGYLLQDLITHVGSNRSGNARKIIFIGDPAQLPPVGMSSSPALDNDYLRETFELEAAGYELTEIVRQKADSAVIHNVMPLRESLAKGHFTSLSFTFGDDVIRLNKDDVIPLYMKIREGRGPQAPVVITHSNAEAAEFNRAIRARLFPHREFVAAGDTVIVAANGFCATHYIANGEILSIESVEPMVERRSVQLRQKVAGGDMVETLDVALNFRDVAVAIPQPEGDDLVLSAKILDSFLHSKHASLAPAEQRALYVDFVRRHKHLDGKKDRGEFLLALRSDPYFNALRLRFGYAITCHKAQGGEWSHVIVNCETSQNPRSANNFRWLYTAMTRTSGKLYLANPPDIRIEPVGPGWFTPSRADPSASMTAQAPPAADTPAPEAGQNTGSEPGRSPQAAFRQWLQAEVRTHLAETAIEIEDVAHHQYQEAYFLRRGSDAARININYKGNWAISGVSCPRPSAFADAVLERLGSLVGQKPAGSLARSGPVIEPTRPFLKTFHDRLMAAMAARDISVTDLKEQIWSQRYTFARGMDSVMVDIFFNGREQLKSFMPVHPSANPGATLVALQSDVLTVLTTEVRP